MIDLAATKANLVNSGRKMASWGRIHGFNPASVAQVLNGYYTVKNPSGSPIYSRIIQALKEDDLLVEASDKAA